MSRASIGSELEVKDFESDVFKVLQPEVRVAPKTADAEGASNISLKLSLAKLTLCFGQLSSVVKRTLLYLRQAWK